MAVTAFRNAPYVLLDDSRLPHAAGLSYLYHSPSDVITAHSFGEIAGALKAIDTAVASGKHVAGWVSYEAASVFEERLAAVITEKADEPLIWMMVTDTVEVLSQREVERLFHDAEMGNRRAIELERGEPAETRHEYQEALTAINKYIEAGDVYQINHTFRLPLKLTGDIVALYQRLRAVQPVSYGALINTGDHHIVSLSPELFVQKMGGQLTSRPMKGTAPRGLTTEKGMEAEAHLQSDSKSLAENLMIVDLIRNDMSRISNPASVSVPARFSTEKYSTLYQMTSTVCAEAVDSLTPSSLLQAMFPCGSVTGAPKIRAMEIIAELEKQPRGVYCGAIGHFSHRKKNGVTSDHWCLNVPIRTLVFNKKGEGRFAIGSGIVADSDVQSEYDECLLKGAFLENTPHDFSLIETMRLESGSVQYRDLHLERLADSASYFDFPFNREAIEGQLHLHMSVLQETTEPLHRLRLLMDRRGEVTITSAPFQDTAEDGVIHIALSSEPVYSHDYHLYHKTTRRRVYDAGFKKAASRGCADILYFNELGHLTEGAISNVFIEKHGQLYTPPRADGLLPGVLRRHLLETHATIEEKSLILDDLLEADALYIGNALRGLRRAVLLRENGKPLYL